MSTDHSLFDAGSVLLDSGLTHRNTRLAYRTWGAGIGRAGPAVASEPIAESGPELRDLLNRMLIDRIKEQETEAIAASAHDASALQRYRELQLRRKQLELAVQPNAASAGS